ncbi:MAG: ATP-binding protein [Muribaculaceae bacterium]|nr:ATP-binding protein [Muribaculaceae bacterium]
MEIINRSFYTDKVLRLFGKGLIIALTGQRRVGKSYVMKQVINTLSATSSNHIIYIDKESEQFSGIANHSNLTKYVEQKLKKDKRNYLFIDEIQNIEQFELSLRSFHTQEQCEIMITGSNAKILSSELSSYLSGRCVEYHIQSLDYSEFLQFHQLPDDNKSLLSYLANGGLPQLYRIGLDETDLVADYLQNVYNTIVLKDIVEREQIRNVPILKNLVRFISDNIGKPISATNIVKYLNSQRVETSTKVILNYLSYLCNAFIIHRVPRYDIHGKRLFEINDKYYFEDIGIRNILVQGGLAKSIEKVIENAVFLHLNRLGYEVTVGYMQKAEIDFVARRNDEQLYVQVAYLLSSDDTVQREFGNLAMIRDNYPKIVVSMDELYGGTNYEGIRHIHLRDFLTGTEW